MRILRRLLFCLVVGVSVFGVVGWMCRPHPNWTVNLGRGCEENFRTSLADSPILWLGLRTSQVDRRGHELALDAQTGAILGKIDIENDDWRSERVIEDGRLLVITWHSSEGHTTATSLTIYEAGRDGPIESRRFEGKWEFTRDRKCLYRTIDEANGRRLQVLDARDGSTLFSKTFVGKRYFPSHCTFDCRGFAGVYVRFDDLAKMPQGMEVWDLKADRIVASVRFPPLEGTGPGAHISWPYFDPLGPFVDAEVWTKDSHYHLARVLTLDLETGELKDDPYKPVVDPPNFADGAIVSANPRNGGWRIWVSESRRPYSLWWCLERRGEVVVPWKKAPLSTHLPFGHHVNGYSNENATAWIDLLNPPNELLFKVNESHPSHLVPETFRKLLPRQWRRWAPVTCFRWHDVRTNDYIDIGCDSSTRSTNRTRNSFYTSSTSDDGDTLIQSWPLPPRDPRKPATAAAVVAMAATWWFFHRRARKKTTAA